MVHQHFKLVHNFTVTENIILGKETVKGLTIDKKGPREKIVKLSEAYKLFVDPDSIVENITVGMQQRVEILKMLYRDSEILIFDEPTAVLTPQEIEELIAIMRAMRDEGKTIILITHKLREIMLVADRCTIIRRGKVVATVDVRDVTLEQIAEMMVGRKINFRIDKKPLNAGEETIRIEDVEVLDHRKLKAVKGLTLSARAGEILGIAGVDGNGQTQLIEALTGLRRIESGKVEVLGTDITRAPVRKRYETGIGHIPEDRHKYGLVLDFSMEDNLVISTYYRPPFSKGGILNRRNIREHAEKLIGEFGIQSSKGPVTTARSMSGGNQQKAILAREVDHSPRVLVVAQPTRGLDVGAIEYVHQRLLAERDKGKTILLFSLDLDEILDLSDRIAVMYEGRIMGIVDAKETDEKQLGLMMAGSKGGERT
jgi:simple sugar transport system ATP-binding protein